VAGGSANCPSSGQCECPGHATLLDHSLPDGGSRWVLPTRIEEAVITCQVEMGRIPYRAGIHVCPGAPSARLELRVLCEELLRGTSIQPAEGGGSGACVLSRERVRPATAVVPVTAARAARKTKCALALLEDRPRSVFPVSRITLREWREGVGGGSESARY
jgi:hypothetical protein